jgi:MFS family permease
MGAGFTITTVFLTRQATASGLHGIGTFFAAYAGTGFVFRWVSRSWSASIGRHRVILLGLAGHVVGYLLLIPVKSEWGFVLPAILHGFGHALLFPCVVSLGAGAFPPEYRGTGTTIILAFVDLGTMISAPLLGRLIEHEGFTRTYLVMMALTLATGVIYGVLRFRMPDSDGVPVIDEEIVMEAVPGPESAVVSLSSSSITPVAASSTPSEPATCRRA